MYILSIVDYSDRSSQLEVFNKYNHLIGYFEERFDQLEDDDLIYQETRKFVDMIIEKGEYCEDYYEYKILEL